MSGKQVKQRKTKEKFTGMPKGLRIWARAAMSQTEIERVINPSIPHHERVDLSGKEAQRATGLVKITTSN